MSNIPEELIEQVRDAADVVELVGEHVQLRRTGSDYRGPCPFHGGSHRNFAVIPRKQMYYCFVCHEGGDVFSFYMKHLGMEYPAAVRAVAQRVGIAIPERASAGPDPREPLFSAVAAAHDWYQRQLREAKEADRARRYLQGRGFDLEAILPLGLGFAPGGNAFLSAMATLGVEERTLVAAGLAVERDGKTRARFWDRLLFPIHDLRGRVVGFGGRVLRDAEPKYLNSPESEIFHKGRLLYNLHEAKHAIRKAEHAVLVEGYFDVIRVAGAEIEHVIAPLGTGFTEDQAALLRRYTPRVTLLFDSDTAGLRATFRTADQLLRAKVRVAVASLPEGEDPDTLVAQSGRRGIEQVLRDAVDVFERKMQLLERKGWLADLSGRRRALDRLLPTLRAAADPVTRDLYLTRVTEALGVSRDAVLREMQERAPAHPVQRAHTSPAPARPVSLQRAERMVLLAMLHDHDLHQRIVDLDVDQSHLAPVAREVFAILAERPRDVPPGDLLDRLGGDARRALESLLRDPWPQGDGVTAVAAALDELQGRPLEDEIAQLNRAIPLARDEDKPALLRQKEELSRRLNELKPGRRWNVIRTRRGSAR